MKVKVVLLLVVILSVEFLARLGLALYAQVPFFQPKEIVLHYYPMLKKLAEKRKSVSADTYNILVLSCSTLHPEWGKFEQLIQSELPGSKAQPRTAQPVNYEVYVASGIGFSSLDNLNCYELLSHLDFDLVVFYGGINDARMNNCPKDVFKQDYSHLAWSNETNCVMRHPEANFCTFPLFVDFVFQKIKQRVCEARFVPIHYLLASDWWRYGHEQKSLSVFNNNIAQIQEKCAQRNTKLLLLSYAFYLPSDYSLGKFKSQELDYDFQHNSRETEIWGKPQHVADFLTATNASLSNHDETNCVFYDMNDSLRGNPKFFADICHFSPAGLAQFTYLLAREIELVTTKKTNR